ncbi:MAG: roadblock/LC7 domain-containing protein [Halobacteriales archaeon]|nr:roadblock/LC7 domain-containing protein [Halobacteriales archaeon]
MQAMGRGAIDYVVKAPHYQKTLAQRVSAAIERGEDLARMGAAIKHSGDAAPVGGQQQAAAQMQPQPQFDAKGLQRVVKDAVRGDVHGAAVLDAQGRAMASKLPAGLDASALGAALVAMQVQAHLALRQLGAGGAARVVLLDYDGGLLAMAALPGPALAVLLMDPGADHEAAVRRARDVAQQAWEASKA